MERRVACVIHSSLMRAPGGPEGSTVGRRVILYSHGN